MKEELSLSLEEEKLVTTLGDSIFFYSEVTKSTALKLIKILEEKEKETKEKTKESITPIKLYINSYGGSLACGFLIADRIEAMKRPVHTIIEGATASAGTLISMVGNKRYIRPRAKMLIHQHTSGFGWGKANEIEDFAANSKQNTKMILDFYEDYTLMDRDFLKELLKTDLYFNATDCIEMGFADEILK